MTKRTKKLPEPTRNDVDYERIEELRKQRTDWLAKNPGRFLEPNDPRDGGRWYLACPDEAEELSDLEDLARG